MTSAPPVVLQPDWPLETERLLLRPFEAGDLEAFHAIHSDEGVARYLYNDPRTFEGSKDLLERKIAGSALRAEGDWLSAAVEVRDVEFLRALTDRRIKITVPGPFTMTQQAQNDYYPDLRSLAFAYAEAVNEELRDLRAAGADVVQIDEPYLQARPEAGRGEPGGGVGR